MTYTELKGSDDEVEGFFGIATSDFNFLIIRLTPEGYIEVLAHIEGAH